MHEGSHLNADEAAHPRFLEALYAAEPYPGLDEHLVACTECRVVAAKLARMDRIHREAPIPDPRPGLLDEILARTSGRRAPGRSRRGRPAQVQRPTESELANHLRKVHNLVIGTSDDYIEGHRFPHLQRLHVHEEGVEPHEHPWD